MEKIVLDEATAAKLSSPRGVELFDESGQSLGFFVPSGSAEAARVWASLESTSEACERAMKEIEANGGVTTAEVIQYLEDLMASAT